MSWYVDKRGRQLWVEKDELVFTVDDPPEELPVQDLAYLSTEIKQSVYQEHSVDGEIGRGKKAKEKGAGATRGYVVRVGNQDEKTKVINCFQEVADKLVDTGVVSRIDVDDSGRERKAKKKKNKISATGETIVKEEEPVEIAAPLITLAINECNVQIIARCQHFTHGPGFKVAVSESGLRSIIVFYTGKQVVEAGAFHKQLIEVTEATGARVMEGTMVAPPPEKEEKAEKKKERAADGGGGGGYAAEQKDLAQNAEDDWLAQMMGNCMVPKETVAAAEAKAAGDAAPESKFKCGDDVRIEKKNCVIDGRVGKIVSDARMEDGEVTFDVQVRARTRPFAEKDLVAVS